LCPRKLQVRADARIRAVPARLARSLSLRDLIVYGLLFIGPLAPR
jgi:hypothetical protein